MNKHLTKGFKGKIGPDNKRRSLAGLSIFLILAFLLSGCGAATPVPTQVVSTTEPGSATPAPTPPASTPTQAPPTATPVPTPRPEATIFSKYQALMPGILKDNNIPGLAIAVVNENQVLWAEGFGYTDTDHKTPVDVQTIFSMQSISKNFTSIAVLLAAQEGLVDLDTPISTYLPDFHIKSIFEDQPEQKITLKHLLSHTAGFTHDAPIGSNYDNTPATFEEHIKSISQTWLKFPVGQGYSYSNLGIDLAGYILQVRSGQPFEQYMQEKVLGPLGMSASSFNKAEITRATNRATGHSAASPKIPVGVPMLAAGGLYSNVTDMAKYLQFFINQGVANTATGPTRVAPESLLDTIYAPPSMLLRKQGSGWGVFVGRKFNTYYIGSGGGGFGFLDDFLFYPELKIGIVTLTNSADHSLQVKLSAQILDAIINDPGTLYHQRMLQLNGQSLAPWEEPGEATSEKAADIPTLLKKLAPVPTVQDKLRWNEYTGTYQVNMWGQPAFKASISVSGEQLAFESQGQTVKLVEVRPGLFFAENGEALDFTGPVPLAMGIRLVKQ